MNKPAYSFPGSEESTLAEVGGKGLSLMVASKEGLSVPPGFIVTVAFFDPWFSTLKASSAWDTLLKANDSQLEKAFDSLKKSAAKLSFTKEQQQTLSTNLKNFKNESLFAVRSSSPEEDLEGSSFAGGYETILGVTPKNIKSAVRKAFLSCLDYRVAVYKRENGFDIRDPKIAVIVQKQIASDIAGVGFSLNPVTNNFDDAVFAANWGLGESVVAGITTPDTFTVDKISLKIKEKVLGAKETTIFLQSSGGTKESKHHRSRELTLSDEQIHELTKLIIKVEKLYDKPIDIEWAYEKNKLYLLQARPVSVYVPLSPEMMTKPGEKKRLYIDLTISIQGMYRPISVTGTSFFHLIFMTLGKFLFLRNITKDIATSLPWVSNGRLYVNFSNILKLMSKKTYHRFIMYFDPLAAKIIESLAEDYTSDTPKWKLLPIGVALRFPRVALHVHAAETSPEETHKVIAKRLKRFMLKARVLAKADIPLTKLAPKLAQSMFMNVFLNTVPVFILSRITLGKMKKIAGKELEHAFEPLGVALPHNVTTEMGLSLYHVAQLLPEGLTQKQLQDGLEKQSLPKTFLSAWEEFLSAYGHRGPLELDMATPRYRDNPQFLPDLLLSLKKAGKQDNPQEKFEQNQQKSKEAYEYLLKEVQKNNPKKAKEFESLYKIFAVFGGYREIHKYYMIFVVDLLRQRVIKEGTALYEAKRLHSVEQVFNLTLEEIDRAKHDLSFDLIKQARLNTLFSDRLSKISQLPTIIDSRGFIPRPPKSAAIGGEVVGTPVSSGVIQGRIKVLHSSNEKVLNKGEILVARATDPGWTPLFVNAGAVILEIGGVLQHGALVAREYGLPCVAGVENATSLWKDGTLVEVDGSSGIIKIIKEND